MSGSKVNFGYDIKNGVKYAAICKSYREGGKVRTKQISFGRVIDEKAGIYRNWNTHVVLGGLNRNEIREEVRK